MMSDEAPDLLDYLALETKRVRVLEVDTLPIVLGKHANVLQLTPHVKQVVVKLLHKARANLSEKTRFNSFFFPLFSLSPLLARVHACAVSVCLYLFLSLFVLSNLFASHSVSLSLCPSLVAFSLTRPFFRYSLSLQTLA